MSLKSDLKDFLSESNFRLRKRWGQNFLIDENIQDKIIGSIGLKKSDIVIEIGPGMGAITKKLLGIVFLVYAIEIDRKLSDYLRDRFQDKENFRLINADFLESNLEGFKGIDEKFIIVGNLPYYISSPIIEHIINNRHRIKSAYITVQKEFGERICASKGTKEYGSLSLFVQYYLKPKYLFGIKRNSFFPPPNVDSVFIKLEVLENPPCIVKDEEIFFRLVRGVFTKRRKKLINSVPLEKFKIEKADFIDILKGLKIDPMLRGEALGLEEFAKIANSLAETNPASSI